MAQIEIVMPKMGESVMEATITKWLKNEGDRIEYEEPIVEIATDKVDSEVPSTDSGVLVKKLYNEGDVVQIGQPFAIIETSENAQVADSIEKKEEVVIPEPAIIEKIEEPIRVAAATQVEQVFSGDKFYSPLVKSIAKEEGISQAELDAIPGTGKDGRLTKDDLLAYISSGRKNLSSPIASTVDTSPAPTPKSAPKIVSEPVFTPPSVSVSGSDEIVEMDRMRKLIAQNMVASKRISAHVTSFVEADVTNIVLWRERVKDEFQKKTGQKITYTPIFIEALAKTIQDFPMVNTSIDGEKIIKRKNINIGMATALPSGNLIVPVIKNADQMNLIGLTSSVNDLANRARNNKLKLDEIEGGTYTITNVGSFGNVMGTPIIQQPQVAIMAVGAIRKKPAVIETPTGDVIGIRHFMMLSHSYDHRIIDGSLGGMFVRRFADYLEAFDLNREI